MLPELKLDWCSYDAAKYAVEHWHYSRRMPAGKLVKIGVWENGLFIGAVLFGLGSGNSTVGTRYNLKKRFEMAELVRIALSKHENSVSRIVSISIKLFKKMSPNIKMLTSMADPSQNHKGTIYQAGGWIYTGTTGRSNEYYFNGRWVHQRNVTGKYDLKSLLARPKPGKHRYLMPLDKKTELEIIKFKLPYPKTASEVKGDTPGNHPGEGGSTPTRTLDFVGESDT